MSNNPSTYGLSPSLIRTSWRTLVRSPWQSLLMIFGIMLGVAVVVGVDMANQSASRAFDLSTDTITGKATHFIAGGPTGLDEAIFTELKREGLAVALAPVITEYVTAEELSDRPMQLLGIDPFSEAPFRNFLATDTGIPIADLTQFLTTPGAILIATTLAEQYNLTIGDQLSLNISGQIQPATITGLLDPADSLAQRALNGIILADIATAQELTGKIGRLDKIDLILPESDETLANQIEALLPANTNLLASAARTGTVEQMTAAFRTNLTALSLLALVVGVFLIYNTMTFSVVQRRGFFGTLRCLGVTRREVFLLVIAEAYIVGTIGGILGIGLGLFLGQSTVRLVTQTINDLFFVLTVQDVPIPWSSLVKGTILGIVATVTAAAFPAWEAASVPPRAALTRSNFESKIQGTLPWVALAGLAVILAGIGLLAIPTRSLVIAFSGTFAIVIGFALLTPWITRIAMRWLTPIGEFLGGAIGRMAPREVVNSISRTSIAIAALMIAVSVSIGVDVMVGSFRYTVVTWMEQLLQGDIYISVPGASLTQTNTTIESDIVTTIREWDGVESAYVLRNAQVDSPYGPIQIGANDNSDEIDENFFLDATAPPAEMRTAIMAGAISISEPLATRLGIEEAGGSLSLFTDQGPVDFIIAGIYYDYSSTEGSVMMGLETYQSYWDDAQISAIAVNLLPGYDVDAITQDFQTTFLPIQSLDIRPNQALRAETLKVFDRTFAITGALQILATIVAFIGVLSAMLSLQLEKQRQLGILRAIGLTRGQLWQLVLLETGLMGSVAGLLAIPTGYVLSLILVYIINRRSFGWTLQMQISPEPFIQAFLIALVAALLAGIYPARRINQRQTADTIRFE